MSWFGSSKNRELEVKIEQATSESIPNGDIDFALALEISDLVRSKQVPAKDAMRMLKKRFMDGSNANLQKASLKLIDFCIKNGGSHFIFESASKEFMDPLVIFLKNKSNNESVKDYLLELIQTWSILVSKDSTFDYINTIYRKLQDDGFQFPEITEFVDSTLIESKVAPEWQDSDACMMCSELFTLLNRKHHCRSCGGVFCSAHSSETSSIPELGINIPVRVCDNCYADQKDKRKKTKQARKNKKSGIPSDEDDLRKAIELSLQDSGMMNEPKKRTDVTQETGDDDEAMRTAIEASLKDFEKFKASATKEEPIVQKEESTGLYSNLMNDVSDFNHHYEIQNQDQIQLQNNQQQYQPYGQLLQPAQEQYQPQKQIQKQYEHSQGHYQYLPQQYINTSQHEPQFQQNIKPVFHADPSLLSGEDEQSVVEFVDILNRIKSIPQSQRVVDPSLVQLHTKLVLLNSKINQQIEKEKAEMEKCQAMYTKSFAVSRLYDDILAYRLKQEQQMLRTKSPYASKFSRPAPPIPIAASQNNNETKTDKPQVIEKTHLPAVSVTPTSKASVKEYTIAESKTSAEGAISLEKTPITVEPKNENILEQSEQKPAFISSESPSKNLNEEKLEKVEPSLPAIPSDPSEQPADRLKELKSTIIPKSYALPPKIDFPSVPVASLPSKPKEELVANLIDI